MATEFTVLLYPPVGRPRVVEVRKLPGIANPLQCFPDRAAAELALEKFLEENPEYRRWCDGAIRKEPMASAPAERQ